MKIVRLTCYSAALMVLFFVIAAKLWMMTPSSAETGPVRREDREEDFFRASLAENFSHSHYSSLDYYIDTLDLTAR